MLRDLEAVVRKVELRIGHIGIEYNRAISLARSFKTINANKAIIERPSCKKLKVMSDEWLPAFTARGTL